MEQLHKLVEVQQMVLQIQEMVRVLVPTLVVQVL
jgi:hypothetical protein